MIHKYTKYWRFNSKEKSYYKSLKHNLNNIVKDEISLIQICQDLNITHNFRKVINKNENEYFECIEPKISYYSFLSWITIIPKLLKGFSHFIIKRNWKKLYAKLGIKNYHNSNHITITSRIRNFWLALKFFINLSNRKDLLDHHYKRIKCGDLIYDSYLRFAKKPTLNIKNFTLLLFIYDCYNQIDFFQSFVKSKKINKYFSSYSTYISHGVPVRVLLNHGVRVFIIGYSTFDNFKIKELNQNDYSQVSPHWRYKKIFKTLKSKKILIDLGLKKIENRLNGLEKLDYMDSDQYDPNKKKNLDSKFDGIVFIGDFTDVQHIYRSLVYDDLYLWFIDTVRIVRKYNLNVGFKPHPNNKPESKIIINNLKNKYPEISWIDPKVSNTSIFESGIKFGISAYGTVLTELAYNNIVPICCGDNPCSDFDFIFEAKNKFDYQNIIKNALKLKLPSDTKKQLGEFIYMDKIYFSKMR